MSRGAVFFDRDGVLNRDIGYAHRPDQIEWMPGAFAGVRRANASGRLAFVVTNQAGVARGFYDEATVEALHTWMAERFAAEGARIDAFIYCPHHPDGTVPGYDVVCDHRKPGPGMIETLIARHDVDRRRSFLIGDRESDMGAARAASILGLLHDGTDLEARVAEGLRLTGEQP